MTALLDVNVLIALGWPNHVHHAAAQRWFTQFSSNGWATTPITEAGYVRISSNRSVMQVSTTPAIAIAQLAAMTSLAGHTFWPDDVPLIVGSAGDRDAVSNHRRGHRLPSHRLGRALRGPVGHIRCRTGRFSIRRPRRGVVVTGDGRLARPAGSAGAGAPGRTPAGRRFWPTRAARRCWARARRQPARKPWWRRHRRRTR